jgi:hypothetical protein
MRRSGKRWRGRAAGAVLAGLWLAAGRAGPPPLPGSGLAWWVYASETMSFGTATLALDPDRGPAQHLSSRCQGRMGDDGTSEGRCRNVDTDGDGWDEVFRCDQPIPAAPLAQGLRDARTGCMGEVEISGATGKYAGLSGTGVFAQYAVSRTPDGQVIGYALRQYAVGP